MLLPSEEVQRFSPQRNLKKLEGKLQRDTNQGGEGQAMCFLVCGEHDPPEFRRQQREFAEARGAG